jgi:hypothetical protein
MPFQPDIVINTPDGTTLVVEAKVRLADLRATEDGLKRYMAGMQCPVGLLVTPERIWLYKDSYTGRTSESIERIGEFDAKSLWQQAPPIEAARFEIFVQEWLRDLTRQRSDELPYDLRKVLQEYVLPAVADGEVRAAHPRYSY